MLVSRKLYIWCRSLERGNALRDGSSEGFFLDVFARQITFLTSLSPLLVCAVGSLHAFRLCRPVVGSQQ